MSRTGILVAAHGAAVTNAMFLPQHAALVEIFPPLLKKLTYAALAHAAGVHHMPLYSTRLVPPEDADADALDGPKRMRGVTYARDCVAANVTSLDALRIPAW